jgi:hypothetical protein
MGMVLFFSEFGSQELLGAGFGLCIIGVSIWLLNYWVWKPDRESRRRRARQATEELHRRYRLAFQNRRFRNKQSST